MAQTRKRRVWISLSVTALVSFIGAGAGYFAGHELALNLAESRLSQYAENIQTAGNAAANEAHKTLASLNASSNPLCSDADIADFRLRIFQAEYLKDVGRMDDGHILCSASLGRILQPSRQYQPDFIQKDGSRVYMNLEPFRIVNLRTMSLQLGNSMIVYRPQLQRRFASDSGSVRFMLTAQDPSNPISHQLWKTFPDMPSQYLVKDGRFKLGENLYATNCELAHAMCVTTGITIEDALSSSRFMIDGALITGAVIGGFLGLFSSIVYRRSRSMEHQLRRAIRRDQLRMVYQPVVELHSRRIVGAEVLARWTDQDGFSVGPDIFVKIAEERGFVQEITEMVVRHALRDFAAVLQRNPEFRLCVNVTATDLADPEFLPMLDRALQRTGTRAQSLTIEVTESSTARHEIARETTRKLQRRGHDVYIDDFGTGYSSLAYLHELAVDAIKIDKAFVRTIGTEAVTKIILPQILSIAETLKLEMVVEGIETEEQALYFANANLSIRAQGWLYGYPVPADEFLRNLAKDGQVAGSCPRKDKSSIANL
jgi:sensor c-di-GMP phosphodiesterase-like protein